MWGGYDLEMMNCHVPWVVLELWASFGYRFYYSTSYLGVPTWDPTFGKYPRIGHACYPPTVPAFFGRKGPREYQSLLPQ